MFEGAFFLDLFQLEVRAESEEDKQIQWEFLREIAVANPMQLDAEIEPEVLLPVELKLEPMVSPASDLLVALVETNVSDSPKPQPSAPITETASENRDDGDFAWRTLAESDHLGLFLLDFQTNEFRFSRGWKELLGYREDELPDRHETLIKLIHPEDSEATPDRSDHGIPGARKNFQLEFRLRHKRGHYIWVQAAGVQEFGQQGELCRVSGFHLDVTDRKELEEESLQNEDRFLTLIQRGKIGFLDLDLQNRTAFISPALARLLGYSDHNDAPENFRKILHSRNASHPDLVSLFEDGNGSPVFIRELRLPTADGSYISLQMHIVRTVNRRGELTRVVGLHLETESEAPIPWRGPTPPAALTAALNSASEAIVITDNHGAVTFLNKKAVHLTTVPEEEALGIPLTDAIPFLQIQNGKPAPNLADEVLTSGFPLLFTRNFAIGRPEEQNPRPIVLSCVPLQSEDERILGIALIFRDPDEMSLTPEELVKSNRMESLGLLAGSVAHDFNNLLTTIVGGIALARETREWEHLENSEKAGLAAKTLTRQLLTFARSRNSGRKVVDPGNLLRDCARLASAGSKVDLKMEISPNASPVFVDVSRINQVFQNLIINGIQAMDSPGLLQVRAENRTICGNEIEGLPAGDYVKISVSDSGKGIPPENLKRIFEPFFTTKKTGTGLGLSTVHAIVRDHDGQITVQSKQGQGSTFTVYLPKSERALEVETRRAPTFKFGTGRILFMDDDAEIAELAGAMLKRLDYEFDIARNGEEALALYRRRLQIQRPYDAVILDLTIAGGMGGEKTFQKLRQMDPDVRAIVSSGYSTPETEEYYLENGFLGILSKPYRSDEMGKVLRQVLGIDPVAED